MEKHDSMAAIREYKHHNHIVENMNGIIYNAVVHAENSTGRTLYYEETEFCFSTNKYGHEEVVIDWKLTPDTYHSIGLYGGYSVAFCQFDFIDKKLIIHDDKTTISIDDIL